MKKLIYPVLSLALLFSSLVSGAQDEKTKERKKFEFVKEKNISKTYPAAGNQLDIENSFGNVKVIPWDKNEIKVDIHIEASANEQALVQKIFDAISVNDRQQGNKVEFETKIDNKKGRIDNCKNCKSTMSIDYEVRLPVTVALEIENSFGSIILPDYKGAVSLTSKFGDLTTGNLANVKKMGVEFGSAKVKSVSDLDASFKFSKIDIDNLAGKSKINLEFCDATSINLGNQLSSLTLNESYSSVNIKPGGLEASYKVATSFGSFVDRTSTGVKRTDTPDKYGPDSNRTFEGGSGAAKIDIKSSFGNIILGEPTADDLKNRKEKSKNKHKSKAAVHI